MCFLVGFDDGLGDAASLGHCESLLFGPAADLGRALPVHDLADKLLLTWASGPRNSYRTGCLNEAIEKLLQRFAVLRTEVNLILRFTQPEGARDDILGAPVQIIRDGDSLYSCHRADTTGRTGRFLLPRRSVTPQGKHQPYQNCADYDTGNLDRNYLADVPGGER